MSRGWVPINDDDPIWGTDDEPSNHYESISARADALAKWWSDLNTEAERAEWRRQSDYEDGNGYDPGEDYPRGSWYDGGEDDPQYIADVASFEAEMQKVEDARRAVIALRDEQMRYCETRLAELGVRLMRPYEHWNEDEAYMQWAERDRD